MPKISVIIPTYNAEKFLPRTISSVLNQTFKEFELIIVDDCSSDKTGEIIEGFEKKDGRITGVFLDKNSGAPAHPKNIGVGLSKGDYIAFLDHDDEWLPQKLERQLNLVDAVGKEKFGVVSCNAFEIDETKPGQSAGKIAKPAIGLKHPKAVDIKGKDGLFSVFKLLKYESVHDVLANPGFYCGNNSSMFFSRETIEIIGPRDENIGAFEDTDIIFRIAQAGYDFYFIDEPLYRTYTHGGNFTKSYDRLSEREAAKRAENFSSFTEKYRGLYEKMTRLYSKRLRGIGMLYMVGGEAGSARKFFLKAVKANPFIFKNYVNLFLSFFGQNFYRKLFSFNKRI